MDRDYHGSISLSNRYRIAIDRDRPDPHKIKDDGHDARHPFLPRINNARERICRATDHHLPSHAHRL